MPNTTNFDPAFFEELYFGIEQSMDSNTPGGLNRGTLITVDGETVESILLQRYLQELQGNDFNDGAYLQWYTANLTVMTTDILLTALREGKTVEHYPILGDNTVSAEPTQFITPNYRPARKLPHQLSGWQKFVNGFLGLFGRESSAMRAARRYEEELRNRHRATKEMLDRRLQEHIMQEHTMPEPQEEEELTLQRALEESRRLEEERAQQREELSKKKSPEENRRPEHQQQRQQEENVLLDADTREQMTQDRYRTLFVHLQGSLLPDQKVRIAELEKHFTALNERGAGKQDLEGVLQFFLNAAEQDEKLRPVALALSEYNSYRVDAINTQDRSKELSSFNMLCKEVHDYLHARLPETGINAIDPDMNLNTLVSLKLLSHLRTNSIGLLPVPPQDAHFIDFVGPDVEGPQAMRGIPLFPHEPCMDDICQGSESDCYLLSTLSGCAAFDPQRIKESIRDNGDGTVTVRLYEKGISLEDAGNNYSDNLKPVYIRVTKEPEQGAHGCLWVNLYEKAYVASGLMESLGKTAQPGKAVLDEKYNELSQRWPELVTGAPIPPVRLNRLPDETPEQLRQRENAASKNAVKEISQVKANYPWLFPPQNQGKLTPWNPKVINIQERTPDSFLTIFYGQAGCQKVVPMGYTFQDYLDASVRFERQDMSVSPADAFAAMCSSNDPVKYKAFYNEFCQYANRKNPPEVTSTNAFMLPETIQELDKTFQSKSGLTAEERSRAVNILQYVAGTYASDPSIQNADLPGMTPAFMQPASNAKQNCVFEAIRKGAADNHPITANCGHVYTVLGTETLDGLRYVKMRDPFGKSRESVAQQLSDPLAEIDLPEEGKGVFLMKIERFCQKYDEVAISPVQHRTPTVQNELSRQAANRNAEQRANNRGLEVPSAASTPIMGL